MQSMEKYWANNLAIFLGQIPPLPLLLLLLLVPFLSVLVGCSAYFLKPPGWPSIPKGGGREKEQRGCRNFGALTFSFLPFTRTWRKTEEKKLSCTLDSMVRANFPPYDMRGLRVWKSKCTEVSLSLSWIRYSGHAVSLPPLEETTDFWGIGEVGSRSGYVLFLFQGFSSFSSE